MQYITEFLNLRERLNHSYINAKILINIEPKSEIINKIFENPKIWYQIILRIKLLMNIGENIFKLESPEVFGRIKKELNDSVRGIQFIRWEENKKPESCQQIVSYTQTLSRLLRDMSNYEYTIKHEKIETTRETVKKQRQGIHFQCQALAEKLEQSLLMEGGWNPEFLQLSKTYWHNRIQLEGAVVRQIVLVDQQRPFSSREFRDALFVLVESDGIAEETLALTSSLQKRIDLAQQFLVDKNVRSITQYFTTVENKIINFLEV